MFGVRGILWWSKNVIMLGNTEMARIQLLDELRFHDIICLNCTLYNPNNKYYSDFLSEI